MPLNKTNQKLLYNHYAGVQQFKTQLIHIICFVNWHTTQGKHLLEINRKMIYTRFSSRNFILTLTSLRSLSNFSLCCWYLSLASSSFCVDAESPTRGAAWRASTSDRYASNSTLKYENCIKMLTLQIHASEKLISDISQSVEVKVANQCVWPQRPMKL